MFKENQNTEWGLLQELCVRGRNPACQSIWSGVYYMDHGGNQVNNLGTYIRVRCIM